jgi:anti-sigma factor RsiW
MSRFSARSWSQENWHPSEDELFCYVDGELKAAENQRIKTHLEACWACRVKGEKIQANIASFVNLMDRAVTQKDDLQSPPRQWRTFDAKVSKVMSEFSRPSLLARWSASVRDRFTAIYLPFRLVGGLALILALAALGLRFEETATVSASELLHKAVQAEVRQVRTPSLPVVHQKLRVRRKPDAPLREEIVTLETWNDSKSGQFALLAATSEGQEFSRAPLESLALERRASENGRFAKRDSKARQPELAAVSPILLELGQIFRANNINGRKPLSPTNYETWRNAVNQRAERVEEMDLSDGGKGLVLSTNALGPVATHSIIQADLVVRVEDWHPVAETLRVQGEGEGEVRDYELTETAFDLVALNSLSPSVFASITSPTTRPLPSIAVPPLAGAPAPAAILTSEIMVRYALHGVRACLGEQIEILTTDLGGIEVRGLAETAQRKEQLIGVLQNIPLVTLKIQSVVEAQGMITPPGRTPAESNAELHPNTSEGSVVTVRASRLPIQDGLTRYFTQHGGNPTSSEAESGGSVADVHQKIVALSSQAISLADMALADAFALRQLADLLVKTRSLELASRWLLEAMIREHLQAIQATTLHSRSLLVPVLRSLEAGKEKVAVGRGLEEMTPGSDWAGGVLHLFRGIERMERLTAFLFAGASLPEDQGGQAVAKLLAAFDQIEQESQRLLDHASRPNKSDSATLTQER